MTGKQQIIANLFLDFGNMVFEGDYGLGNNVEVENVLNDFNCIYYIKKGPYFT